MSKNQVQIGIAGAGVVGGGVAQLLKRNEERFRREQGVDLRLKAICDISNERIAELGLKDVAAVNDIEKLTADPEIGLIVETIGGTGIAKTLMENALANGKCVVTANKALLAKHGPDLFKTALTNGCFVGFEASVGGGIPVIRTMMDALVAERVDHLHAIINGTCNFILTAMTNEGKGYAEVLKEAQANGYAEADPTFDVEGHDSMHKLTLLTWLAFGQWIPHEAIPHTGITGVAAIDIEMATAMGYRIKLLATAGAVGEQGICAYVAPHLIPASAGLARVDGVLNAVLINSDNLGSTLLSGRGAGRWPTASAVVSDIVQIARQRQQGVRPHYPDPTPATGGAGRRTLVALPETRHRYYLRFTIEDRAGVLAVIAKSLGDHGISIKALDQPEQLTTDGHATVVILTHEALEKSLLAALAEVDKSSVIKSPTVFFRIEEQLQ